MNHHGAPTGHNRPGYNRQHHQHQQQSQTFPQQNSGPFDGNANGKNSSENMVTPEPDIDVMAWQNMTRTLAHYERLEQIGEGTYGQVYRARCKDTGRIVAMKKMRIHHGGYWGMPLQLIREIKILKRLHHPRLLSMIEVVTSKGVEYLDTDDPPLKSVGESDKVSDAREAYKGNLFLVLEYVEHDLTGLLDVAYQFSEVQIKCIFKQLLEALKFMHENKYVHRDIKSSNILLDSYFRLKLADFGLARCIEPSILEQMKSTSDRSVSSSAEFTNKVITLWYRPPEILLGACQYGPAVDVWSAGCILAELILGKPLFAGKTELEQLHLVIDMLGTPSTETWDYFAKMKKAKPSSSTSGPALDLPAIRRDTPLKKSRLRDKYGEKLKGPAMQLVEKLLEWDPRKRMTAANALQNSYFWKSPAAPEDPAELGRLDVGPEGHFHEFQTKKKRKEAKAAAEKVRSEAIDRGATQEEAGEEYDKAYTGIMKKVAQEGISAEPSRQKGNGAAQDYQDGSRAKGDHNDDRGGGRTGESRSSSRREGREWRGERGRGERESSRSENRSRRDREPRDRDRGDDRRELDERRDHGRDERRERRRSKEREDRRRGKDKEDRHEHRSRERDRGDYDRSHRDRRRDERSRDERRKRDSSDPDRRAKRENDDVDRNDLEDSDRRSRRDDEGRRSRRDRHRDSHRDRDEESSHKRKNRDEDGTERGRRRRSKERRLDGPESSSRREEGRSSAPESETTDRGDGARMPEVKGENDSAEDKGVPPGNESNPEGPGGKDSQDNRDVKPESDGDRGSRNPERSDRENRKSRDERGERSRDRSRRDDDRNRSSRHERSRERRERRGDRRSERSDRERGRDRDSDGERRRSRSRREESRRRSRSYDSWEDRDRDPSWRDRENPDRPPHDDGYGRGPPSHRADELRGMPPGDDARGNRRNMGPPPHDNGPPFRDGPGPYGPPRHFRDDHGPPRHFRDDRRGPSPGRYGPADGGRRDNSPPRRDGRDYYGRQPRDEGRRGWEENRDRENYGPQRGDRGRH